MLTGLTFTGLYVLGPASLSGFIFSSIPQFYAWLAALPQRSLWAALPLLGPLPSLSLTAESG